MKIYDIPIKLLNGELLDWSTIKGKKLLVVNVASECGYTFHYEHLEALFSNYRNQNFIILGCPCNDFGAQEPGSATEIQAFCKKNYGVTFLLSERINIKENPVHPLYQWLTSETETEVAWNFQKYGVNENGEVEIMFPHKMRPDDAEIIAWIEK